MLLCVAGPRLSGKKTFLAHLKSLEYRIFEFNELLCEHIMNEKIWNENMAVILSDLSLWKHFIKRPFVKLIIIHAPSKSDWRDENDDEFIKSHVKLSQNRYTDKLVNVLNFGTIQDMYNNFDSLSLKIRPSFDEYFMNIAFTVSERSNCMKLKVGAIIVKDTRIISTGYNGTPTRVQNCYEGGCKRCNSNTKNGIDLDNCMCLHAEESALLNAGYERSKGSNMYVTHFPCQLCYRKIIQMGIKKVFYREKYSIKDDYMTKCFETASIEIIKLD